MEKKSKLKTFTLRARTYYEKLQFFSQWATCASNVFLSCLLLFIIYNMITLETLRNMCVIHLVNMIMLCCLMYGCVTTVWDMYVVHLTYVFFSARLITCGSNVGMCTEYDGRLRDYQGGISGFYIYSLETHFSHLFIIWT